MNTTSAPTTSSRACWNTCAGSAASGARSISNGLIEDALNLAYHGARAQNVSFNVTLERDYALALAVIEVAPQEMTRVLLNLLGNSFYAVNKRHTRTVRPHSVPFSQ